MSSIENNTKILVGSISKALDKRLVFGDSKNNAIVLLNIIANKIEYCLKQYEAGKIEYYEKYKYLVNLLNNLRDQCEDICNYKNRLIISTGNTAPVIQDNTINVNFSESFENLNYNDVIYGYSDEQLDLISQVLITSKNGNEIMVDDSLAVINKIYNPNIDFSVKLSLDSTKSYIIKNDYSGGSCEGKVVRLDKDEYENSLLEYNVINIHNSGSTILQKVSNQISELPNDTIVYMHIDTSSIQSSDIEDIETVALSWWNDFKNDNPDFEGSFIINTVDNSIIGNDHASGRGGNGKVYILGSNMFDDTPYPQDVCGCEQWLQNPTEGLLRQAWKEGRNDFINEQDFFNYIQGKSLVVLTFVDETDPAYYDTEGSFVAFDLNGVVQPTTKYIQDYTNFITKVRPYLTFFKGVLYPITIINSNVRDNFMLHSMAAMEATILTSTQIDTLMGTDKVNMYGATNMQNYFYNNLSSNNPYQNLDQLKPSGWRADFTKFSPIGDLINSQEFADELNSILTDTEDIEVTIVEEIEIDSFEFQDNPTSSFTVKVRDNNPLNPLYSNNANITVNHVPECEEVPQCGSTNQVTINHKQTYTIQWSDITDDLNVDKIKIIELTNSSGQFKYFNLTLTNLNIPIIVKKSDVENGDFKYIPDDLIQEEYSSGFKYTESLQNSINYCNETDYSELTITKLANTNQPAIITVSDQNLTVENSSSETSTIINATIDYQGTGGYQIYWTLESGDPNVSMSGVNTTNLSLSVLQVGTYVFKITVTTNEDNLVSEATSTITVTAEN